MTSPNEWWKEEPYATTIKDPYCLVDHTIYNIEAIIEEIKRREREREYHICCKQCGLSTVFSPNDK